MGNSVSATDNPPCTPRKRRLSSAGPGSPTSRPQFQAPSNSHSRTSVPKRPRFLERVEPENPSTVKHETQLFVDDEESLFVEDNIIEKPEIVAQESSANRIDEQESPKARATGIVRAIGLQDAVLQSSNGQQLFHEDRSQGNGRHKDHDGQFARFEVINDVAVSQSLQENARAGLAPTNDGTTNDSTKTNGKGDMSTELSFLVQASSPNDISQNGHQLNNDALPNITNDDETREEIDTDEVTRTVEASSLEDESSHENSSSRLAANVTMSKVNSTVIPATQESVPSEDNNIQIVSPTSSTVITSTVTNGSQSFLHEASSPNILWPRGSASESWMGSQEYMLKYLRGTQDLEALSLAGFLKNHGLKLPETSTPVGDTAQARLDLAMYLVAPRGTHATKPSEMPVGHLKMCSAIHKYTTEEFVSRVWRLVSKPEASAANAEQYIGPWYYIAETLGREWVVFLVLHHHIFKPWVHGSVGSWIQLTGSLNYDQGGVMKFGSRASSTIDQIPPISKSDIMYRKYNTKKPPPFVALTESDRSRLHPNLQALSLIVENRMGQYNRLLLSGKVFMPPVNREKRQFSTIQEVLQFLKRGLSKLLPYRVLGSKHNHACFYKTLQKFLKAPGFAKIPLQSLIKGLKLTEIPWLSATGELAVMNRESQQYLMQCMQWLYESAVKPLLLRFFYLTEMSGKPGSMYYYEQDFWKEHMEAPAREKLVHRHEAASEDDNGKSEQKENKKTKQNDSAVGASAGRVAHSDMPADQPVSVEGEKLRIVPKSDGSSRPIINLKGFNQNIQTEHLILQHSMAPNPSRLDSWHSWIIRLYEYRENMTKKHDGAQPRFHIVKLDIDGCYDNANVNKVKEVVARTLNGGRDVYSVRTGKCYSLNNKRLQIRDLVVTLPDSNRYPHSHENETIAATPIPRTQIISNIRSNRIFQGDEAMAGVLKVFDGLYVKVSPEKSVKFVNGIPQGSACSLDLCNLLLDDLVTTKLSKFQNDAESMLLRYVDDFIFISTNETLAVEFKDTMLAGFKNEYGVACKLQKVASVISEKEHRRTKLVTFLGMQFNTRTLDVKPKHVPIIFAFKDVHNLITVKRKLDAEMESVLGALRSFARHGKPPPRKLVTDTANQFGAILVDRLDSFSKIYGQGTRITQEQAYWRTVHHNLIRLVPEDLKKRACHVVRESYITQFQRRLAN